MYVRMYVCMYVCMYIIHSWHCCINNIKKYFSNLVLHVCMYAKRIIFTGPHLNMFYVCMYVCMYVSCLCMYVCVHVCMHKELYSYVLGLDTLEHALFMYACMYISCLCMYVCYAQRIVFICAHVGHT